VIIGGLLDHYYEINEGIGVHKSPKLYGAFPTDPYSHTPAGKGAQQPGMTGQVKEDILCRFGELGVFVENGNVLFNPRLLRRDEFLDTARDFTYTNLNKELKTIQVEKGSLCFTYCQIPVVYKLDGEIGTQVIYNDNTTKDFNTLQLDLETSRSVFKRTGDINKIIVSLNN
jgi:hypothetical protein